MKREKLYIATIDENAEAVINKYNLGVELDQFCTAANLLAPDSDKYHLQVKGLLKEKRRAVFHAPFNELHPAAIDPEALLLAEKRYEQSYMLTKKYGINRMVVHSGYLPFVYYKAWHVERSVEFWKKFMENKEEEFHIYIENVLEDEPEILADIITAVDDTRVKACLDIGHAGCMSSLQVSDWVGALAPVIGHVHLHNNMGEHDDHRPLGEGTIPIKSVLEKMTTELDEDVTYTLESCESEKSIKWLMEKGFLI